MAMNEPTTMILDMDPLILSALREDINSGDISTNSVIKTEAPYEAKLICKEDGILCGLDVFERVFTLLDEHFVVDARFQDGSRIENGVVVATVRGDGRAMLSGERTALNYLQRMSGIATYTAEMVQRLEGTGIKLLDTRKTTPNMRIFEKYAVRVGGGYNHRYNLSNGVMLKDNHIAAAGGITEAILMARDYASFVHKIEIEVETVEGAREAAEAGADIIMLDNMTPEVMKDAIEVIDGRALIEVSGNVTEERLAELRDLRIDYISSGALTHSAPILDLSLKEMRLAE